jgi:hypothetical protein
LKNLLYVDFINRILGKYSVFSVYLRNVKRSSQEASAPLEPQPLQVGSSQMFVEAAAAKPYKRRRSNDPFFWSEESLPISPRRDLAFTMSSDKNLYPSI